MQCENPSSTSISAQSQPQAPAEIDSDQCIYDLCRFTLADMVQCGRVLRHLTDNSNNLEEAARKVIHFLYEHLRDKSTNRRCCVLVRFFVTQPYGALDPKVSELGASASTVALSQGTECLCLLATIGDDPLWNSRHPYRDQQHLPLTSEAIVKGFPMIRELGRQLGREMGEPGPKASRISKNENQKSFGIFHVASVANSPFIAVEKEFAEAYGVSSALGFGGLLANGELFAVIIFARAAIPPVAAEMFRTIGLNLRLSLLALSDKPVFAG